MENSEVFEHELHLRKRIIDNCIKERNNCIVLKIDRRQNEIGFINPFGFHFELDKEKYKQRKKQLKRERITRWFSWAATYHHKFGIRHILLVTLLFIYVVVGASLFLALEESNENESLADTTELMEKITDRDVKVAINITLSSDGQQREDELAHLFRFYYKTLMQAEGKFHGSVWHKSENLDLRRTWTFSSSAFYSITLFSTIGYGTIACQTTAGRIITIIYACIGLPLMLVVLGDLGEWFQKILTQSYIFCLCKVRRFLNKEDLSEEELEAVFLPIWLALPLVALYVFLTAFFIILFDHDEGQQPGIQTWDAVYFTFISLTTIGLGDVMPFNIQYSPILACVFLLGLALVSIVNTSVYAQLYDLFFKTVLWMEETLEKIHRQQNKGTGYYVFQDLGPSIQLLVCSFPHVDDIDMVAAPIKAMFQPLDIFMKGKHKHKKLLIPHIFKKIKKESEPQSPTSPRFRAPTLGAFGGVDLSQQKSVTKRITRHASDVAAGKIAKQIRARSVDEHPFSVERASAAELVKKAMASTIIDITKEFSSQNEEPRLPTPEVEPPPYFAIVMSEQEEEPLSNLTIEEELSEPEDLSGTSENSPSQNTNMDNPNDNL